ncbi:MAG: hypothetical protein Q8906_16305 [Bacillota bacterium]|nr:hypothetical protein [Bacillota bacterium]MDP4172174.1 hypothetical protein [Bacillota bacterium]
MDDLFIFWHHVGREHGGLDYTEDIRKNSLQDIQMYLEIKENHYRNVDHPNRFLRYDESTLIELPPLKSGQSFIIVYSIPDGFQFSLNYKTKYPGWIIDIVDIEEIRPNVFCIHDLFIDIAVSETGRYQVLDIDEYETAISLNVMTTEQIQRSLKSFHAILTELNSNNFPDRKLGVIKEQYLLSDVETKKITI